MVLVKNPSSFPVVLKRKPAAIAPVINKQGAFSKRKLAPVESTEEIYNPTRHGANCADCPLHAQGAVPVPTLCIRNATMAVVGEHPTQLETERGSYFSGASGAKLNAICVSNRIDRDSELHVNNALQCRPKSKLSAVEWREALACCEPRLKAELQQCGAKIFLGMGRQGHRALTGHATNLPDWAGGASRPLESLGLPEDSWVIATYHPQFALQGAVAYIPVFYAHFTMAWEIALGQKEVWLGCKNKFITCNKAMLSALKRLRKLKTLGYDVETAGDMRADLLCVGFASTTTAVSVPWPVEKYCDDPKLTNQITHEVKAILADPEITLIAHNAIHDKLTAKYQKMPLNGVVEDTILAHAIVAPTVLHRLQFAAFMEFIGVPWKTIFGARSDEKGLAKFTKAPIAVLCDYNADDACVGLLLWNAVKNRLRDEHNGMNLYKTRLALSEVSAQMYEHGTYINRDKLDHHRVVCIKERKKAYRQIQRIARDVNFRVMKKQTKLNVPAEVIDYRELNPNSGAHLGELFFSKLKVTPRRYSIKTGKPSLDAKTLTFLLISPNLRVSKAARALLTYRRWTKLQKSYVDQIPLDENSRVHPTGNPIGTISGRWSYKNSEMNPQVMPKPKTRKGKRLNKITRKMESVKIVEIPGLRDIIGPTPLKEVVKFDLDGKLIQPTTRGKGFHFLEADYSQIELRILALLANDPLLLKWYSEGRDVHTMNAQALFGREDITSRQRDLAKRFVYAVNYGGDDKTIWMSLVTDFEGLLLSDIIRLRDAWYRTHPRLRSWQREVLQFARENDFIQCPLSGRRRYFHGLVKATEVFNFPIQGTGADIIDPALLKIAADIDWCNEALLFQVHDAVVLETNRVVKTAQLLKKHMEAAVELNGKIIETPIDFKISNSSWGEAVECKSVKEVAEYVEENPGRIII